LKQCYLTADTTKSEFCAVNGLHEISVKLARHCSYKCQNSSEIFFFV